MFHVPHKVGAGRTAKNCLTLRSKGRRAIKPRGSMPFCVELDNLKDTDAPIHQPAAMLVAAD